MWCCAASRIARVNTNGYLSLEVTENVAMNGCGRRASYTKRARSLVLQGLNEWCRREGERRSRLSFAPTRRPASFTQPGVLAAVSSPRVGARLVAISAHSQHALGSNRPKQQLGDHFRKTSTRHRRLSLKRSRCKSKMSSEPTLAVPRSMRSHINFDAGDFCYGAVHFGQRFDSLMGP